MITITPATDTNPRTYRVDNPEDVVSFIAATATRVIASANAPGHNLDQVAAVVLSDASLDTIRDAVHRHFDTGETVPEVIRAVGGALVRSYYRSAKIDPTDYPTPTGSAPAPAPSSRTQTVKQVTAVTSTVTLRIKP